MRNTFHYTREGRVWFVVGRPLIDIILVVDEVCFRAGSVLFRCGGAKAEVAHRGGQMAWGDKGNSTSDLSQFVTWPGAVLSTGGGQSHTAPHLQRLVSQTGRTERVIALDNSGDSAQLADYYRRAGISRQSIPPLEPVSHNLVLCCPPVPERVILRGPSSGVDLAGTKWDVPMQHGVLLFNSPRSRSLVTAAISTAKSAGCDQYSVLSGSLSTVDTIGLFMARDQISVCNLSEFGMIASHLGISCPNDEQIARPEGIASALLRMHQLLGPHNIVVTLGAQGCVLITLDAQCHCIAPKSRVVERVNAFLENNGQHKNGTGDRFFAALAFYHVFCRDVPLAALLASINVVNHLSDGLSASVDSYNVVPLDTKVREAAA